MWQAGHVKTVDLDHIRPPRRDILHTIFNMRNVRDRLDARTLKVFFLRAICCAVGHDHNLAAIIGHQ